MDRWALTINVAGHSMRGKLSTMIMGNVVAVADLKVENAVLAQAETAMRTGSSRLDPIERAVQNLDPEVVGAEPLSEALHTAHEKLAVATGVMSQALAALAQHTRDTGTTVGNQDSAWAQGIRQGAR